jgi:hypothetical protein
MKKNAEDNGYFLFPDQQLFGEIITKNEINRALAMHRLRVPLRTRDVSANMPNLHSQSRVIRTLCDRGKNG